jgi:hypothetical protein
LAAAGVLGLAFTLFARFAGEAFGVGLRHGNGAGAGEMQRRGRLVTEKRNGAGAGEMQQRGRLVTEKLERTGSWRRVATGDRASQRSGIAASRGADVRFGRASTAYHDDVGGGLASGDRDPAGRVPRKSWGKAGDRDRGGGAALVKSSGAALIAEARGPEIVTK